MDPPSRGRSPAVNHQNKNLASRSPSARSFHDAQPTLNPSLLQSSAAAAHPFGDLDASFASSIPHDFSQPYLQPSSSSADNSFLSHAPSHQQQQDSTATTSFDSISDIDLINSTDFSAYADPSLFAADDQTFLDSAMAATHSQAAQPPHYLAQDYSHSQISSQHSTPAMQQNGFEGSLYQQDPRRQSLDPSSAYNIGQNGNWNRDAFQQYQHRRTPSDQFSDISSSAQPSPNLNEADAFDVGQHSNYHSPLLQPADPAMQSNSLGLEQFSLNEFTDPRRSPHISPHLQPRDQGLPTLSSEDSFNMMNPDQSFQQSMINDNMFSQSGQEAFPSVLSNNSSPGLEQNGTMSPPVIHVVEAERQPTFNENTDQDSRGGALSPPMRSVHGRRDRAKSDPYANARGMSRSVSPVARPRSPSLGVPHAGALTPNSLSRSSSPSPNPNGITKRRYSSPDRAKIIAMAEGRTSDIGDSASAANFALEGSASTGSDTNRKVQKHPAIFQCSLCPKRFTRAYNLRSHLRTHTDERPFVCSVCGKAFARQHDRKRHEGLHTGEKKFVCRGTCTAAGGETMNWGCGRRFARADALGRHFRSEAGRACIKPLMDEEARLRQADQMEQANQGFMSGDAMSQYGQQQTEPQTSSAVPSMGTVNFNGMPLPAALLQQYPALAEIQWSAVPGPGAPGGADDIDDFGTSPRSSFEAGSGGEFDEDGYLSGDSPWDPPEISGGQQQQQQPQHHGQSNWI